MATLFFYDYFLVLSDEVRPIIVSGICSSLKLLMQQVKYVWKGRKTWCKYPNLLPGYCEGLTSAVSVLCLSYRQESTLLGRPG